MVEHHDRFDSTGDPGRVTGYRAAARHVQRAQPPERALGATASSHTSVARARRPDTRVGADFAPDLSLQPGVRLDDRPNRVRVPASARTALSVLKTHSTTKRIEARIRGESLQSYGKSIEHH